MSAETLEKRVDILELKLHEVEDRLLSKATDTSDVKRGWRTIVGIDADNPLYERAAISGKIWRYADRPDDTNSHG